MSIKRKDRKGRILRNGEVQRSDGKYMFRYVDLSGWRKAVYSWKLVDTDKVPEGKKCDRSLREMEKQIQRDLDDKINTADGDTMTVDDLYEQFMADRLDLKETTRCSYAHLYDTHIRDTLGYKKVGAVKYSDIQRIYLCMLTKENYKMGTVQSVHSILYQMFDMAMIESIIRTNPTASALKKAKRLSERKETQQRHALSIEEQARLVDFVYHDKTYRRWGPLFTVLLGTGMRIGEALGLRWCDCDFDANTITVDHILVYKEREVDRKYEYRITTPKTITSKRVIPMFAEVREALLKIKETQQCIAKPFEVDGYTDFIFLNSHGKVFTPGAVFSTIQRITDAYNREEHFLAEKENRDPCFLPKFSAHILRHTFCTRLCENKTDIKVVQDVMGHRKITTTMDVYNEATTLRKRDSFQSLEGKIKLA